MWLKAIFGRYQTQYNVNPMALMTYLGAAHLLK